MNQKKKKKTTESLFVIPWLSFWQTQKILPSPSGFPLSLVFLNKIERKKKGKMKAAATKAEVSKMVSSEKMQQRERVSELEIRPGGMLVQMRDFDQSLSIPTIKVKVKYGSSYHHIQISSHSSFGKPHLSSYSSIQSLKCLGLNGQNLWYIW